MSRTISSEHLSKEAREDLWRGLLFREAWVQLAMQEVHQRFRRSALGPFWLTLSTAILVGTLSLITSTLLNQDASEAILYIAIGIIAWNFLIGCITDGSTMFILRKSFILNIPMPISVHLYQTLARNLIILAFNMIIYLGLLLILMPPLNAHWFMIAVGAPLFLANVAWMTLVAGVLSTRFRDIPQIILSATQVVFFLTPVFWSVESLPLHPPFVIYNPLYRMLEIVREPLLGHWPGFTSLGICAIMAVIGWAAAIHLYRRAYARIAYWV